MKRAPRGSDELRRARRDEDHEHDRRQERRAGLEGRVAEDVLQELLADERRAHERAEDDDPGAGGDPEDPPAGDVQVVQRVRGAALADDEGDQRGDARGRRGPSASVPLFGTGAKLIARISAPTRTTDRMPPRLSTGVGRLVDVGRHERNAMHERDDGERQRDEEHRAPPELLEQGAGDERAERGDAAADRRPQRDRLASAPGPTTAR